MAKKTLKAGIIARTTCWNNTPLQEGLLEEIIESIHEQDLDIFLGPEWLFIPKDRLYTKEEKDIISSKLAAASKEKNTLIIPGSIMWFDKNLFYNTSPIIAEGKVLGEYHKHFDCGSTFKAKNRGCIDKEYFKGHSFERHKWREYRMSIEICADQGELARFLGTRPQEPLLDLYFLVSCGPYLRLDIPVKNLGYGLCSNGDSLKTEVVRKENIDGDEKRRLLKVIHSKNNIKDYIPRIDIYELEMN